VDKAKYLGSVEGYDPREDQTLDRLLGLEPPEEDDEAAAEIDYGALEKRVTAALGGNKRLKSNVIGELEEALERAPGDKKILALIKQLQ
jgi:hypothetical protein